MHEPSSGLQPHARRRRVPSTLACAVIVASGLAWITCRAIGLAVDLPTEHLDGAFQTASGLYRLRDGQWPGRDFLPYLGIGPLVTLLPFFLAGGGDLAASVTSSHALTLCLAVFNVAVLWHLVFAPRRVVASAAAAVVLIVGAQALLPGAGVSWPEWFDYALRPGNSLRPVRSALPYLLVAGFLAVSRLQGPRWERWRAALWGAMAGACVLWSNDYAYTTALLFCAVAAVAAWRGEGLRRSRALAFALVACVTAAVALLAATAGHPLELLRYNFIDVAGNQWWVFSPYHQEARAFGWADLPRLLLYDTHLPLAVLAVVLVWAVVRRSARAGLLAFIGTALFAGGAAATLGGFFAFYFGAFRFWGGMLGLILVARVLWSCVMRLLVQVGPAETKQPLGAVAAGAAALAIAAGSLSLVWTGWRQLQAKVSAAASDAGRFFVPELGGYLSTAWREAVAQARLRPDDVLIEEYWGLWSALRGGRSGWRVDAVIHALGSTQAQAEAALRRADVLTSTRRTASPGWQPWNLTQNLWFYRELLDHWTPDSLTPTTVVWRRRSGGVPPAEPVACTVQGGEWPRVVLNAPAAGLHELALRYRLTGSGRALVLAHNGLSPVTEGWASIDPRAEQARVPVGVVEAGERALPLRVFGRPATALQLLGCSAQRLAPPPPEVWVPQAPADDPVYLNDAEWDRGISRRWAGFHVEASPLHLVRYQPGRVVRFATGELRRILRAELHGRYLHVHVGGAPWPSTDSGSPGGFWVLDLPETATRD